MKPKLKNYFIFLICLNFLLPFYSVNAAGQYFEGLSLKNDITIASDDQNFEAIFSANTFANTLVIYINENLTTTLPENLTPLGKIYNLNIIGQKINPQPIKITINYQGEQDEYTAKSIYQWQDDNKWKKLNSFNRVNNKTLTADLLGDSFTLGVFETRTTTLNYGENFYYSPDGELKIITPNEWQNNFSITYKNFDHLNYPENLKRISNIYEFDLKKEKPLITKPLTLKIAYQNQDNQAKDLYYWDNNQQNWIKMDTINDFVNKILTTQTNFSYLRFAVFLRTDLQEGETSWYRYKNCLCAASRDYPKGTKLKITNITFGSKNYGKSIIVRVNDFGPALWTKRLIDLDRKAYQQIANLKSGIMKIRIEKIND